MTPYYIPPDRFPMELCPGVTMLGNYFFNLFLVRGSQKSALFETGISGIIDSVILQLEDLGVEPDYLVLSHPHSDHITGLTGLCKRFPKAEIITAKGAQEFVSHPKAGPLLLREDGFMSLGLEKKGIRPGRPPLETVPDLKGARTVEETTRLDLGNLDLELIPVQGHSPGNLMGWVESTRVLFCSDSLGFHFPGRGFWPLFFTGADTYLKGLDRIRDLDPRILCPAHQGPLKEKAVPQKIQESIETTLEAIKRINTTDLSDEDLALEMFQESYKDEFTLYTQDNIKNCARLLIKRAREFQGICRKA